MKAQANLRQRFGPYPEYEDSGVEWLGKVPSHWTINRLKTTVMSCQNGLWGEEPDGLHDVVCVRVADFDRNSLRVDLSQPTLRSIEARAKKGRLLSRGDLLLEKSGGGEKQPVGAVVLYDSDEQAVCSNFIARMTVGASFDARYLAYLHSAVYSVRLNTRSIKQSTGIQNLDSDSYLSELAALPPLPEQRTIADFLDREALNLDELVAKKRRLIELLQEKRAALGVLAVTKGLNSRVPLVDSCVAWMGEIPATWSSLRTKFVARLESGHTPSRQNPEYWEDCTIPWFGLADVWRIRDGRREYIDDTNERVSEIGLAHSSARLLPKGTVILSRTASVGFSAVMARDMATTQDFANWICGPRIRPEYLLYVFRAMVQEFRRLTMGSTHQTIYMPDIGRFFTPLPPLEEQDQIVAFIREQAKGIDTLIDQVEEALELLKEYRISLISAAVTGKIDVREERS